MLPAVGAPDYLCSTVLQRELPEPILPDGTAACFARVGAENLVPALVTFGRSRLVVERDDAPDWLASTSSLEVILHRFGLVLTTTGGETITLDFKERRRRRSLPEGVRAGPISKLWARAAFEGEALSATGRMTGPNLVRLRSLQFHQLARFLECHAISYRRASRYSTAKVAALPFNALTELGLLVLLLIVWLAFWFIVAVTIPAAITSQFWEVGPGLSAWAAVPIAAVVSLLASNLFASVGPALCLKFLRDATTTGFDTVDAVEGLEYAFVPVPPFGRFRPIGMHLAAQFVLPVYVGTAGPGIVMSSPRGLLLLAALVLPVVVLLATTTGAVRRSGASVPLVDPWTERYGTKENTLVHRSTWLVAAGIAIGGAVWHLAALSLFG